MKNYNLTQNTTTGDFYINDIKINNKIFNEELVDWDIESKESITDNLFNWIKEAKGNDIFDCYREMMKEDLKYIIKTEEKDDDLFFSSILTNEYVFKSDNEEEFNNICEEILKLNLTN